MSDLPLISIIVPVYKVEAYLDRCLESLTCQSYRNLQILLVDDGSPDGSGAICDACAERDSPKSRSPRSLPPSVFPSAR